MNSGNYIKNSKILYICRGKFEDKHDKVKKIL